MLRQAEALHISGKLDAAAASYKKLLQALPNNPALLTNLGTIACQKRRDEDAVLLTERSLKIAPDQPSALNTRGNALKNLNRLAEALVCFDRAIALKPDFAEAYSNRGIALQDLIRLDAALADFERAIALNPNFAQACWNKALLKLLLGDYAEGWALYEWGWPCFERRPAKNYRQDLWLGEFAPAGKTLLIHPEQGLGDFVQFVRYAALLEQAGAKLIIEAPAPLRRLVASLAVPCTLLESGEPLPDFDLHCPVMSLPLACKTTLETIPAQTPYLFADEAKRLVWRQRLGEKLKPRVGLAWSGAKGHKNDHNRSIDLKKLADLLALPVEFHSLQTEVRPNDAAFLAESGAVFTHENLLEDFSDTAALLAEMDLIISVDTSVAHLAGALGKPVWILLPYLPDFRWLLDRADSPWYPTAKLFRQPAFNDWAGVVTELVQQLSAGLESAGG